MKNTKKIIKNIFRGLFVFNFTMFQILSSYGMNFDYEEVEFNSYQRPPFLKKHEQNLGDELVDEGSNLLLASEDTRQFTETEIAPSFDDSNIISRAYVQAFKEEEDETTKKCLVFKYIASLGGFGAGIPGIAAALHAGEHYKSKGLGYLFASATVLYTGGQMSWAIWEFIESSQSSKNRPRVDNEEKLSCSKIGKLVGSFVLGALSSTPAVYIAYKYNSVKGIAVLSFFYEWVFRSLGFYKFISPIKLKKNTKLCESNALKYEAMEYVDQSKVHFLRLYQEGKGEELLYPLKGLNTPHEINTYLTTTNREAQDVETRPMLPYYYAKGIPRKIAQYTALIFPVGGAFVNGVLTYKGFNLITDNQPVLILLTSVSVLPTFVLDSFATKEVAGGIFDAIYSCKTRVMPSDYFGFFNPRLKKAVIGGALALSVVATGVVVYFILDNLEGTFLSPAKYFFTSLAALSAVKFGTYTVANTAMNFGSVIVKHFKKASAYTFNCLKKLESVRNLIWESDKKIVEKFSDDIGNKTTEF